MVTWKSFIPLPLSAASLLGCLPLWACLGLSPLPLPLAHYTRPLDIPKHTDFFSFFQPGFLGPPPHPQDRCLPPHQHLLPMPCVLSLIDVSTMPPSPSLGLEQSQPPFNRIYVSLSPDKNRKRNPDLFPSYSRLKNWNSTVCVCTTGLSLDKLTDLGDLFSLKELYSGLKSV